MSNQAPQDFLEGLTAEEKELALKILNEYADTGSSETLNMMDNYDFEETPVDIHTFLHDRQYLGNGLYNSEGVFTLWPFQEDTLADIFPTNTTTKYNTIIFSGAIGIGKTFIGVICQLYLLYRLLCLRDPYLYYGMTPADKITISLMNITLSAARGVAMDKMNQLLLSSSWFMSHGEFTGTTNLMYNPEKHIELVVASSNNQVVGRALFCLDGDTLIETEDGCYSLRELAETEKLVRVKSVDNFGNIVLSEPCKIEPTIKSDVEYQIELEDGTIIKCTPNHRFLLKDGSYKEAQYLSEEDELWDFNGSSEIKRAEKSQIEEKQFYDVIEANPYHNFLIKTNSGSIAAHNCNLTDEVNFGLTSDVEKLKEKQKTLIAQIDARMRSRFLRTNRDGTPYLPTLNIIISSKNSEQSFLEGYIQNKLTNESKNTLVVDKPQWVVDSRKDSPIKFWVAIGNKFLSNELLPLGISDEGLDVYRNRGYRLLQVPIGYLDVFQDNIDKALTDIAGIATASALKYISGERLLQAKTDSYRNPFTKDIIDVGNAPDDNLQYYNFFDMTAISEEDLARPLFVHLDMSVSGDMTGIAGTWITGRAAPTQKLLTSEDEESNELMNIETEMDGRDLRYKLAFSVSVKAPKGYQVSFEKNRNFIRWLRDKGFAVKIVSSDTFQSASILQELRSDGFTTQVLSVDRVDRTTRTCLPYAFFKSAIYEQRIQIYYKCDQLTNEILGLEKQGDGHINHQDNGKHGSKDVCDAVCGSLYTASKFSEEFAYSYGDSVSTSLDANDTEGDIKSRLIAEFERELFSFSFGDGGSGYAKNVNNSDFQFYRDLDDGIIVL